jgi:uncharacterized membrane protein
MASKHTQLRARSGEVAMSSTTTDSPLLPIEQIERLKEILPHRVEWVFEQTQIESAARRKELSRINTMVFIERIAGLVFALVIAVVGLGIAAYLAMNNHDTAASIIGGTTLVGLVTAFIAGKKAEPKK